MYAAETHCPASRESRFFSFSNPLSSIPRSIEPLSFSLCFHFVEDISSKSRVSSSKVTPSPSLSLPLSLDLYKICGHQFSLVTVVAAEEREGGDFVLAKKNRSPKRKSLAERFVPATVLVHPSRARINFVPLSPAGTCVFMRHSEAYKRWAISDTIKMCISRRCFKRGPRTRDSAPPRRAYFTYGSPMFYFPIPLACFIYRKK